MFVFTLWILHSIVYDPRISFQRPNNCKYRFCLSIRSQERACIYRLCMCLCVWSICLRFPQVRVASASPVYTLSTGAGSLRLAGLPVSFSALFLLDYHKLRALVPVSSSSPPALLSSTRRIYQNIRSNSSVAVTVTWVIVLPLGVIGYPINDVLLSIGLSCFHEIHLWGASG